MGKNIGLLLGYSLLITACGSDSTTISDSGQPAIPFDASIVDAPTIDAFAAVDASIVDAPIIDAYPAIEASIADAPIIDAPVMNAGECRADVSELSRRWFNLPCPSAVDAGVPRPTCINQTPGVRLYRKTCDQRETWTWNWGSHLQECFYTGGTLVGVRLSNDTPAFCDNTSNGLIIGDTTGCPGTQGTLLLDCNPFVDADWRPWSPDAR